MLVLKNVSVSFANGTVPGATILERINLHIRQGEFVVIVGANGTGKSTVINTIAGILQPTTGEIVVDNKNVTKVPQHGRSHYIARVVQDTAAGTMPNLTIFENLAFAFMRRRKRSLLPYALPSRGKFLSQKLETLGIGLEKRMNDLVSSLSGGQRQAINLLMSVLSPSKVLLLDEIVAALDPLASDSVMALIDEIVRSEGRTTLMVTHNMAHAIKYGDRILLLGRRGILREFRGEEKESLIPSRLAKMLSGA